MDLEFSGVLWFWKGPAPWHFVTVPDDDCRELDAACPLVTYGWGMVPVTAQIGHSRWATSLFPQGERYIVPVKAAVRSAERVDVGDLVTVRLWVGV